MRFRMKHNYANISDSCTIKKDTSKLHGSNKKGNFLKHCTFNEKEKPLKGLYTADRQGNLTRNDSFQDHLLEKMYGSALGRCVIKPLIHPVVSQIGGWLLDTRLSALAVPPFIKKHHITMEDYEPKKYRSYNDFFTRKIRASHRFIDQTPSHFISPCDCRLSVYPIQEKCLVNIKHTPYTVAELLKNPALAKQYEGGYLWVFRLCVDDYHRYIYVDQGTESKRVHIPGVFHTVNPVANDVYPIYKENTREYSLLKSKHFGTVLMMEVGALMVGKIINHPVKKVVHRGEEKGHFAFGGSTIILMTQAGCVCPDSDLLSHSKQGIETRIFMGEKIGKGHDAGNTPL